MFSVRPVFVDIQLARVYTMYKHGGVPHAYQSTEMG